MNNAKEFKSYGFSIKLKVNPKGCQKTDYLIITNW